MGFVDKMWNKLTMGEGRSQDDIGRATGDPYLDPYLEAKDQGERMSGADRQVGEQVKDAGNVRDALKK